MDITIASFSPLIQLLAGFYMLIFFEPFFKGNPLMRQYGDIDNLVNSFSIRFQGSVSESQLAKIKNFCASYLNDWDRFIVATKRIFLLLFLMCIFLLVYAAVEPILVEGEHYYSLQAVNYGVIIYSLILWLMRKHDFFIKKYASVVAYFILLIIIFCVLRLINEIWLNYNIPYFITMTRSDISILSMIVCFSGILIMVLHIVYSYARSFQVKRRMWMLSKDIECILNVSMRVLGTKSLPYRIKKDWRRWIDNGDDPRDTGVDQFLQQAINKEIGVFTRHYSRARKVRVFTLIAIRKTFLRRIFR